MRRVTNFYVHPRLDRLSTRRREPGLVEQLIAGGRARLVPVWRGRNLFAEGEAVQPVIVEAASQWLAAAREVVVLGAVEETVYLAVDLGSIEEAELGDVVAGLGRFADLRGVAPLLAPEDGALLAYARAIVWWHERHRFCGVCGGETRSADGGHRRDCVNPACGVQHFPRTDPAVIVLVHDSDRVLLGRQPGWPAGMHSVLAGFLEPGESLEESVRREVMEEAGIAVDDVTYHSSQPWPFPQSLMIGFTARAVTTEIRRGDDELEHAGWYERAMLRAVGEGDDNFRLPRPDSIARRLIEDWLAEDRDP